MTCKYLYIVKDEENRKLYKCEIKDKHIQAIKEAFENTHQGHHAVPNDECPFAYTGDCHLCPLFEQ